MPSALSARAGNLRSGKFVLLMICFLLEFSSFCSIFFGPFELSEGSFLKIGMRALTTLCFMSVFVRFVCFMQTFSFAITTT